MHTLGMKLTQVEKALEEVDRHEALVARLGSYDGVLEEEHDMMALFLSLSLSLSLSISL